MIQRLLVIVICFTFMGCASQLCVKKTYETVPGVGVVTILSIESNNGTTNNLKAIQTYSGGKKTGEYTYGNEGIVYPVISGGMQAGGIIGGAALLRPDRTETNVNGVSSSESSAFQAQGQAQGQMQGQSNTNKPVFNNTNKNTPYHPNKHD